MAENNSSCPQEWREPIQDRYHARQNVDFFFSNDVPFNPVPVGTGLIIDVDPSTEGRREESGLLCGVFLVVDVVVAWGFFACPYAKD